LARFTSGFIDYLQQFVPSVHQHIVFAQEIGPEIPVADPDNKIFFDESKGPQNIDAERHQLDVSGKVHLPDNVAVELEMFAQSSALLFFVTEKLADREPFERLLEFALVCGDHASKRGRELGAHGNFAFAFISEVEKLIDDFYAALLFVELGGFQNGTVPFNKAIATRDFAPTREDVVAYCAVVGKKIAKTGESLH